MPKFGVKRAGKVWEGKGEVWTAKDGGRRGYCRMRVGDERGKRAS